MKKNSTPAAIQRTNKQSIKQPLFRFSAIAIALSLAGCSSIFPMPLSMDEIKTRAQQDLIKAQQDVEPINGQITLEEAIARALKYNLDNRTRMMEEALARNQHDVSKFDMLPQITAAAGYTRRNEFSVTRSENYLTGAPAISTPYISSDREKQVDSLGLTWNFLDFGVSYFTAKQNADRLLIASERRRKSIHNLVQDVRTVFWRAAAAQKLQAEVKSTITLAEEALVDARAAENERLRSPLDSLRYQKQVLDNMRLLEAIEQELSTARVELASLINAPAGTTIEVLDPDETINMAILEMPVEQMEETAIMQNADLREEFYNTRIAAADTRKAILKLFPNLSLSYATKHDNDSYLINKSWNEAGATLSYNLMSLLSAPAQIRMADAGVALADQKRMAKQMAVLTQVNLARIQYANNIRQFQRADELWQVDSRITSHIENRESVGAQSKLERIASQTTSILSMLRRYQALSNVNAAASKLQATLGMEPEIGNLQTASLEEIQSSISSTLAAWNNVAAELAEPEAPALLEQNAVEPEVAETALPEPVAAEADASLVEITEARIETIEPVAEIEPAASVEESNSGPVGYIPEMPLEPADPVLTVESSMPEAAADVQAEAGEPGGYVPQDTAEPIAPVEAIEASEPVASVSEAAAEAELSVTAEPGGYVPEMAVEPVVSEQQAVNQETAQAQPVLVNVQEEIHEVLY